MRPRRPAAFLLLAGLALGCGDGESGGTGSWEAGVPADGPSGAGGTGTGGMSGTLSEHALCSMPYPAQPCSGDPMGAWRMTGLCFNPYRSCAGASVRATGSVMATLEFTGGPTPQYGYQYDYDTELRVSVPASCLNGASCEAIDCFGDKHCSCVNGNSSGGFVSMGWTPVLGTEVVVTGRTSINFCAGATSADSMMNGRRVFWERVCTQGMDCRPADPCHLGQAQCAGAGFTCEDTGKQRQVGTPCGPDQVCDASGACVACQAGGACQVPNQPCKVGVVSCRNAKPECVAQGDLKDGSACGTARTCQKGACIADDGQPCEKDSECRDKCTCGDDKCATKFCGRRCTCQWATPGANVCSGFLVDGTRDPNSCNKACFRGKCLAEVGQTCTSDAACGSGHCTCWLSNCSGGRLCSIPACPCQWARSGAETCGGPLMDGLGDESCRSPQMCVQGMCQ